VLITEPGIFRINAIGREQTDLIVRKGVAVINGRRVKKNERADAIAGATTINDIGSTTSTRSYRMRLTCGAASALISWLTQTNR
jgi:hypothetical protein